MITLLARFEMLKGKETQACQAFKTMTEAVKANEPGCLMYAVTRGQVNAQEIYVYEVYKDQAAADEHGKTVHMTDFRRPSTSTSTAPPSMSSSSMKSPASSVRRSTR